MRRNSEHMNLKRKFLNAHTEEIWCNLYGLKNSGEKINEVSESEVSFDENSTSSDAENDILEDLWDKIKCLKT